MTTQQPVRIVIADDHPIFREGLRHLLAAEADLAVVGQASDGMAALRVTETLRPDVLLLDLAMPKAGGLEVLRELGERQIAVRTIILTAEIEREETIQALQLGARGVVLKEAATQVLCRSVRAVMKGEYWVGHDRVVDIVKALRAKQEDAPPAAQLTRRELQIVGAIVEGASNRDIGQRFGLSEQTVKNHLSHIFDKVGVSNRLELALYALHHGLLQRMPPDER